MNILYILFYFKQRRLLFLFLLKQSKYTNNTVLSFYFYKYFDSKYLLSKIILYNIYFSEVEIVIVAVKNEINIALFSTLSFLRSRTLYVFVQLKKMICHFGWKIVYVYHKIPQLRTWIKIHRHYFGGFSMPHTVIHFSSQYYKRSS